METEERNSIAASLADEKRREANGHCNGKAADTRPHAAIIEDLLELERRMPLPDLDAIRRDALWVEQNWHDLARKYPGTHVAVVDQQVRAATNSLEIELDVARRLGINPQRIVVVYIDDPADPW